MRVHPNKYINNTSGNKEYDVLFTVAALNARLSYRKIFSSLVSESGRTDCNCLTIGRDCSKLGFDKVAFT